LLGLGLVEPNPPTPGLTMDPGDNLDALDVDTVGTAAMFPIFFSLDSAYIDPLEGPPANSGSAAANGFISGAAVLMKAAPLAPIVGYAAPAALGLGLLGPPGSDDLDALAIWENGVPGFQPSPGPYAWAVAAAPSDMLLFSVRRGSAVVGAPDSFFGSPISEGDILMPPMAGGVSPFPAIFIAAENIGLATLRATPGLLPFPPFSDDLDALDVSADCNGDAVPDVFSIAWGIATDCNGNGRPDSCDLAMGASDCNGNGLLDSCELAAGAATDCDGDGILGECECPADIASGGAAPADCIVDVNDLLKVIANWGACTGACPPACPASINGDCVVDVNDLLAVIGSWGACP
jgi:hypothetical protein